MKMTMYEKERMFSMLETMITSLETAEEKEEYIRKYGNVAGATFILWSQDIITDEERKELEKKTNEASLKAIRKINEY